MPHQSPTKRFRWKDPTITILGPFLSGPPLPFLLVYYSFISYYQLLLYLLFFFFSSFNFQAHFSHSLGFHLYIFHLTSPLSLFAFLLKDFDYSVIFY